MITCIANVLDAGALATVRRLVEAEQFVDGQATAGWAARPVKHNEQLRGDAPAYAQVRQLLGAALANNELFALAAAPQGMRPLLVSRYRQGMGYGPHVDNALMGGEHDRIRTDLSFTLFLSEPESYQGGELVIDDIAGEVAYKLAAGALVLYPSTALHRVDPVTQGERLVAIGWLQSLIRDDARRALLFDLETVRRQMFTDGGKSAQFDTLSKCVSNLWRMWAEP
jgi:PKHD-type hydroxylase